MSLNSRIQQVKFDIQRGLAVLRQRPAEVLEHRAHAARDLEVARATGANLAAGDLNVVLPVWGAEDNARPPAFVDDHFTAQLPLANQSQ